MEADGTHRLLAKLQRFVAEELDSDERALLAALIAPGVAGAYHEEVEVEGFGLVEWSSRVLPDALLEGLREWVVRMMRLTPNGADN